MIINLYSEIEQMSELKNKSNKKKKLKKRSSCSKKYTTNNSSIKSNNISNNSNNSKLCCFSALDYMVLASTLAIALGEELSDTDISILSTFFAVLSDELALIESINDCKDNDDDESIFAPPIPDVALTSSKNNINKKIIKKEK